MEIGKIFEIFAILTFCCLGLWWLYMMGRIVHDSMKASQEWAEHMEARLKKEERNDLHIKISYDPTELEKALDAVLDDIEKINNKLKKKYYGKTGV